MKRGLLLAGFVVVGLAGTARADYLKIIVNLAATKDPTLEAQLGAGMARNYSSLARIER